MYLEAFSDVHLPVFFLKPNVSSAPSSPAGTKLTRSSLGTAPSKNYTQYRRRKITTCTLKNEEIYFANGEIFIVSMFSG